MPVSKRKAEPIEEPKPKKCRLVSGEHMKDEGLWEERHKNSKRASKPKVPSPF